MSAYSVKITKEVVEEYRKRLSRTRLINDDIRKKYLGYLDKAVKEKDRPRFFEIMSFVEDWDRRQKSFEEEKNEIKKGSKIKKIRKK